MSGDGCFPIDPVLLEERLDDLVPTSGGFGDSYWHHLFQIDGAELEKTRLRQRVYLARYARQSVFDWEHRDVMELQEYFVALSDIIRDENELSRRHEDR